MTRESESFDQSKITKNYLRETGSEINKIDNVRVDGLKTLPISSFFEFKTREKKKRKGGKRGGGEEEWKGGGDGGRWSGVGNGVTLLLFFIHFNIDCHILDYEILYEQYKSVQMFVKEI